MKRIILIFLLTASVFTLAQEVNIKNIAVVDMALALEQYNKRTTLEEQLEAQRREYDSELSQKKEAILKKELELVKKGEESTKEDLSQLNDLKNGIEDKFKEFDVSLNRLYSSYMYELNSDIAVAAIVVGKEMGFDIVFHKGTTFYGGTDITSEVVEFLNKGEKISLSDEEMKTINNDLKRYKN